jgi:CRAL/TRIO domain/CRAL/TRIO, N-terminal domain
MFSRLRGTTKQEHTESNDADDILEKLAKLRAAIQADSSLDRELLLWADDACLLRFVRAAKFNHDVAVSRLRETLGWRKETRADSILPAKSSPEFSLLRGEAECGKMFVLPRPDKSGRSVIVMRPGFQTIENAEANIRYLIYTLERASRVCSLETDKENNYIVIVDFRAGEFSFRRAPSMSTSNIIQEHYPESLSHAFLFDAPSFFLPLFKMLRPFIDPVTAAKIHFVRRADAANDTACANVLDPLSTPVEYGGQFEYEFDVNEYFTHL